MPVSLFTTNPDGTVNIAIKAGTGNVTQLIDSIAKLTIIANSNNSIIYQGSGSNLLINRIIPVTIEAPDAQTALLLLVQRLVLSQRLTQ